MEKVNTSDRDVSDSRDHGILKDLKEPLETVVGDIDEASHTIRNLLLCFDFDTNDCI